MDDGTRLTLAFAIIGIVLVAGIPTMLVHNRRRRRQKLRRRGIKRYGH